MRKALAISLLSIAVVVGIAASIWGGSHSSPSSSTGLDNPTGSGNPNVPTPVVLFVDPAKVPGSYCNALVADRGGKLLKLKNGVQTPKFSAGATRPVGHGANARLWSDAVNVPLSPRNIPAEQGVVCADPAQAAMVMNGLGKVKVGGTSIAKINSDWMVAQGSPRVINQWAQHCLTNNVQTHLACAKAMSYTAYLLGLFQNLGVHKSHTAWNYHLAGPRVGKVPPFALNPKQYTGYFVEIQYTEKSGNNCVKFGFNVGVSSPNGGDQRLARLTCKSAPTPKPSKPGNVTSSSPSAPMPSHSTHQPPPTPSTPPPTSHTTPPKTCQSVYGPGESGTYPNCHKNGAPSVQPTQPPSATGTNPAPNPTQDPGSNKCYSETTGQPVQPNPDGTCPPGSFGG